MFKKAFILFVASIFLVSFACVEVARADVTLMSQVLPDAPDGWKLDGKGYELHENPLMGYISVSRRFRKDGQTVAVRVIGAEESDFIYESYFSENSSAVQAGDEPNLLEDYNDTFMVGRIFESNPQYYYMTELAHSVVVYNPLPKDEKNVLLTEETANLFIDQIDGDTFKKLVATVVSE